VWVWPHALGPRGQGLQFLSPVEYKHSSGSYIFGEGSLLVQICGIKITT